MKSIWTLGEILVEIMRTEVDKGLETPELFKGPFPSGAPAIFTDTVAKLGVPAGIIGTVGNDDFGRGIMKRLTADGVDCSCIAESQKVSTAATFVSYTSSGDRTFIFHIGNAAAGEIHYPEKMPDNVGIFHVMGCAMLPSDVMCQSVLKAYEYYYNHGAMISFDPNVRVESLRGHNLVKVMAPILEKTEVFLPGVEEMLAVCGETDVDTCTEKLFKNPVLKVIVLKNGSKNTRVISRNEDFIVPTCKIHAVDSTGAGDSFDAGFLTAYQAGKSLKDCVETASAVAALNCEAFGPMEGIINEKTVTEMINKNYRG